MKAPERMYAILDSETFFRNDVLPIAAKYGVHSYLFGYFFKKLSHSKFAFLKDGKIRRFGEFYRYEKCLFSNLRFQQHLSIFVL